MTIEATLSSSGKRRKSVPKTKTGCITCKKRRVKCDETKPGCQRCVKLGFLCDGYALIKKEIGKARIVVKPLLPKPSQLKIFPASVIWQPLLLNEQEYRYFQVFRDQTVSSLSGFFDEALWGRLILQACDLDPTISHTVIAIGALDKTLDITSQARYDTGSVRQSAEAMDGETHYKFAVQQYAKAIKGMRDSVAKGRQNMSYTLIACLLAVCFELFHGNTKSALCQAQSGLRLINQSLKSEGCVTKHVKGTDSPLTNVDGELIQVFDRLDIHAIAFKSSEGVQITSSAKKNLTELCHGMPSTFSSLREARACWESLLRHALHWTACTYFWGSDVRDNPGILRGITGFSADEGKIWISTSSLEERQKILDQQGIYLESLLQWSHAFTPLFQKSHASPNRNTLIGAAALKLRFLASHLALAGSVFKPETQFDAREAIFQEILSLAQFLISELAIREEKTKVSRKINFMFDSGVIGPLYVVAILCRNPHIRRRALVLLEGRPRREGVWDSVLAANAARTVIRIEERGLPNGDGFVPEESRVRGIRLSSDLQLRKGLLQYFMPKIGKEGAFLVRQVEFSW